MTFKYTSSVNMEAIVQVRQDVIKKSKRYQSRIVRSIQFANAHQRTKNFELIILSKDL